MQRAARARHRVRRRRSRSRGLSSCCGPALGSIDRVPRPQACRARRARSRSRPAQPEDRFAVGAATLSLLAALRGGRRRSRCSWTTPTGSTARAPTRCCSRPGVCSRIRSRSCSPCARARHRCSTAPTSPSCASAGSTAPTPPSSSLRHEQPGAAAGTAARLHRATGGNPLALLELAPRGGRPTRCRARRCRSRRASRTAYVQRASARFRRARATCSSSPPPPTRRPRRCSREPRATLGLESATSLPAEEAALVTVDGGRVEFRHPLARSADLRRRVGRPERRDVHAASPRALPDADVDRRAWHLARGRRRARRQPPRPRWSRPARERAIAARTTSRRRRSSAAPASSAADDAAAPAAVRCRRRGLARRARRPRRSRSSTRPAARRRRRVDGAADRAPARPHRAAARPGAARAAPCSSRRPTRADGPTRTRPS